MLASQQQAQPQVQQQKQQQRSQLAPGGDFISRKTNYQSQNQNQNLNPNFGFSNQQQQQQQPHERLKSTLNQIGLRVDNEFLTRSLSKLVEATKSKCLARLRRPSDKTAAAGNGLDAGDELPARELARTPSGWSMPSVLQRSRSLNQSRQVATLPQADPLKCSAASDKWASIRRTEFASRSFNREARARTTLNGEGGGFMDHLLDKKAPMKQAKLPPFGGASNTGAAKQTLMSRARSPIGGPKSILSKQTQSECLGGANKIVKLLKSTVPARRPRRPCGLRVSLPNGTRLLFAACAHLILLFFLNCSSGGGLLAEAASLGAQLAGKPLGPASWVDWSSVRAADSPEDENQDSYNQANPDEMRQTDIGSLLDLIQTELGLQQLQSELNWPQSGSGQSVENQDNARESFSAKEERELEQEQEQQQQPLVVEPNEYFWIERRRLNRDRALEPPAWLRNRPIRSDTFQGQLAGPSEREAGQMAGSKSIPRRAARARQQRQSNSNKYYNDLIKYLLEGTLEGRSILDDFYDSLQARPGSGGTVGTAAGSGSAISDIAQPEGADQLMHTAGQDLKASPLAKMDQGGAGSDQGLIVAGDEISDNEDVTMLDVPPVQVAAVPGQEQQQLLRQIISQPTLVVGRKLQVSGQAPPVEPLVGGTQAESAGRLKLQTNGQYREIGANAGDAGQLEQADSMRAGPSAPPLTLAELMQTANLLAPQQQQQPQQESSGVANLLGSALANGHGNGESTPKLANNNNGDDEEQSFHVIEDIDQADPSQETPVDQNSNTSEPGDSSASKAKRLVEVRPDASRLREAGQADGSQLVLVDVPDANSPRAGRNRLSRVRSGAESLAEANDGLEEQEDEDAALNLMSLVSTNPRRAPIDPAGRSAATKPSIPAGRATAAYAWHLWPLSALTAPNADEQVPPPAQPRQLSVNFANVTSVPSQAGSKTQLTGATAATIELVQSGHFTRQQLIQFVTRLRAYLENRLALPRGSILGLFPETSRELLIELDLTKLTGFNLVHLINNFDYVRGSSSLVLSWPGGGEALGENPVPILKAIMDALYDEQLEARASWPAKAEGLQINEQQQEEEPEQEQDADEADELQTDESVSQQGAARYLSATQAAANLARPGVMSPSWRPQLSRAAAALAPGGQINWAGEKSIVGANFRHATGQQDDQLAVPEQRVASPATWWAGQQYSSDSANDPRLQQRQLPLAVLAAYLNAVYNNLDSLQDESPLAPAWPPADRPLEQLLAGNNLHNSPSGRLFGRAATNGTATASSTGLLASFGHFLSSTSASFLAAMALAFASTYLIVKLIVRKLDKKIMNRYIGAKAGLESDEPSGEDGPAKPVLTSWWPLKVARRESAVDQGAQTIQGKTARDGAGRLLGDSSLSSSHKAPKLADFEHKPQPDGDQQHRCSCRVLRKSMESLSRRWTRLMNKWDEKMEAGCGGTGGQKAPSGQHSGAELGQEECSKCPASANQKLIDAAETRHAAAADETSAGFRTSTSYIRSLIEALTKAATNQMSTQTPPSTRDLRSSQTDDDEEEEANERGARGLLAGSGDESYAPTAAAGQQHKQLFCNDDTGDIVMSQMDISAAHLILDYMEKHLIDKERLRREWLELNANLGPSPAAAGSEGAASSTGSAKSAGNNKASGGPQKGPRGKNCAAKANQLVLQRLAKVALSEENFDKNRDPAVVPFDRNRVRLGAARHATPTGPGGASKSIRNKAPPAGDYINASYIYDDDPRRPTHIIAQSPKEQTCGQFWQMIWEQEISVIVMLTRLNENGEQMCHCYWPLSVTPVAPAGAAPQAMAPAGGRTTPSDHNNSAAGPASGNGCGARRGSVTSVFSGSNVGQHHQHQHHAAPIVASGHLNDNILCFEVPVQRAGRLGKTSTGSSSSGSSSEGCAELADAAAGKQERSPGAKCAAMKLEVHLISEHVSSSDYLVRNMYLINCTTGETRTISQFHYLAWLNGRTPDNVRSFLQFRRKVHKSYRNLKSPILVHCNNGAGRSGTYTLIDMILERIKNGAKEIDLRASLEHLRDQRVGLCETQAQFEFVLVALAEEIQIILNALPQ